VRSRNGFTLIETLIVVVIVGLIVLIGFPKVSQGLVRNELRGARTAVVNLAAKARTVAAQGNRRAWIVFSGDIAYIVATPRTVNDGVSTVDTVGGLQDLGELYKVGVAASVDSISYDPRGFGSWVGGADAVTIVLARGDYTETITVDALGRVTK
jgi:prepilin-type N-terminal cleavage/methylation domain-containing protein